MDGLRDLLDWITTKLFQLLILTVFSLLGAGVSGHLAIGDLEAEWEHRGLWIIFTGWLVGAKAIFDSMIIMSIALGIAACLIGIVGWRAHNREFLRLQHRGELVRNASPQMVALWQTAQQHRLIYHKDLIAILGYLVGQRAMNPSPRVERAIMDRTHKEQAWGQKPTLKPKYRRRINQMLTRMAHYQNDR